MTRAGWLLLAALAMAPPAAAKKAPPPPEAPPAEGVRVEQVEGGRRVDAVLPGRLRGYALPRRADGSRDVVLLVGAVVPPPVPAGSEGQAAAPCESGDLAESARAAPTRLLRLDPSGNGTIEVLRDGLPADARGLDALDVDGDGVEELLLLLPGEIRAFHDADGKRFGRGPEPLVKDASLGRGEPLPRIVRSPAGSGTVLPLATADGLRAFGRLADGRFGLLSSTPLPLSVRLETGGLHVATPFVTEIGPGPSGAPMLASSGDGSTGDGADDFDDGIRADRLRSILLDPLAGPERRAVECWSKLPARERIHERIYRSMDGRPAMVVTTSRGDKLKIFGEKWLRVFLLEEDRTKAGKPPVLAADIGAGLERRVAPSFLDANGDGRTDLVVAYWKGSDRDEVGLDAFFRREDGGFEAPARETTVEVKGGAGAVFSYGRDLDGDGSPDLLVLARGKVLVFPGTKTAPTGKGIVSKAPRWTLSVPSFAPDSGALVPGLDGDDAAGEMRRRALGAPRSVDLDGDGRLEILLDAVLKDGRSAVVIFRLSAREERTR